MEAKADVIAAPLDAPEVPISNMAPACASPVPVIDAVALTVKTTPPAVEESPEELPAENISKKELPEVDESPLEAPLVNIFRKALPEVEVDPSEDPLTEKFWTKEPSVVEDPSEVPSMKTSATDYSY